MTDFVNIKSHIVNIGINFEIEVLPEYNSNEVLLHINRLRDYFDIDNWRINEPINISKIYVEIDKVDGVQTVVRPDREGKGGLQIVNKFNGNYSQTNIVLELTRVVLYIHLKTYLYLMKFQIRILRQVITQQF